MPKTSDFSIRLAMLADVPALNAMIERSVRQLQIKDYTPAQIEGALGHVLGLDTQLLIDQTYFIAEPLDQPGVLAGSGGWSFRHTLFGSDRGPQRESRLLNPLTDPAKIRAIFVDPAWARRGLGSLLLNYCEQAAHQAGFKHFEMGSTLTGVPLYAVKGYFSREKVEVALTNGETFPVIRMTKSPEYGPLFTHKAVENG